MFLHVSGLLLFMNVRVCVQVRLLSEQLRDAQNHTALKDRTGGWRNPAAEADMQVVWRGMALLMVWWAARLVSH